MRDLISRHAAIEAVEKESQIDGAYGYLDTKSIVDLLNDLPSVRKRGQWIKNTIYTIKPDYQAVSYVYTCSECGAQHYPTCDYCPSCGSRNEV